MTAEFINSTGYFLCPTGNFTPGMGYFFGLGALVGWRRRRREYEFLLHDSKPLTILINGVIYAQPDRHGFTDLGTIPEIFEPWLPRNEFEPSFIIHDSTCRHHGLYFSREVDGLYTFTEVSSVWAHDLLGACVLNEGAGKYKSKLVSWAVHFGGPHWEVKV